MKTKINLEKSIGVWLDHEKAYFIKPDKENHAIEKVHATTNQNIAGGEATGIRLGNNRSTNNEYSEQNKRHEHQKEYFKELSNKLKPYDSIYLFGPSTFKSELRNHLNDDKSFHDKTVETANADEMTENQMVEKVLEHFGVEIKRFKAS